MDTFFYKNGKPFFPIGGQCMNSTPLQREDRDIFWRALALMHGNTAEIPIFWSNVEPREGVYDFSLLDTVLAEARQQGKSLILLWFGAWKNGLMRYAPDWVKEDTARFRRVLTHDGYGLSVLSSHCGQTLAADTRAFTELMRHIKTVDGREKTVIGMQIQNEPAICGRALRDYHPEAQAEYDSPVPEALLAFLKEHPDGFPYRAYAEHGCCGDSWQAAFGPEADEFLTSWSMGRYIDTMAEAGKAVYPLPMLVNVALDGYGFRLVGLDYNAGSPIPRVLDIWKAATPCVDAICPDIYQGNPGVFLEYCAAYDREDNPLFIPESDCRRLLQNGVNMFTALGGYKAIGYFSFGIEHVVLDNEINPSYVDLVGSFRAAASVLPLLVEYRGTGNIHTVIQEEYMPNRPIALGDYVGCVEFAYGRTDFRHRHPDVPQDERGRGLIIQTGPREFYLCGGGYRLLLRKRYTEVPLSELRNENTMNFLLVDEGRFDEHGQFQVARRRTGDESDEGLWVYPDVGAVHAIICD